MKSEIEAQFAAICARVETVPLSSRDRRIGRQWISARMADSPLLVDVKRDGRDEFFTVTHHTDADVRIVNVDRPSRHLVLVTKAKNHPAWRTFLCGRDESHWFVAAIPENSQVRTVQDAMNALKPPEVWESIREHNLPESQWNLRRTKAFVRQGEWFFIPSPRTGSGTNRILQREPLSRGIGSQSHWCQELFRTGGIRVWVNSRFPNGLTREQWMRLPAQRRTGEFWRQMQRDARPFIRGWVRHRDHATIDLDGWHQVVMNTESRAAARRHVVFLD